MREDALKTFVKRILKYLDVEPRTLHEKVGKWSITRACAQNGSRELMSKLRDIQPDLSEQYSAGKDVYNDFVELKLRAVHAFQCRLMMLALDAVPNRKIAVVDIGDSAGTHMLYLKELSKDRFDVDTISVNLDPRAIEKVRARGLEAVLCRAEELDPTSQHVDFFTSFEMVEHLHNPAIFFYRLAKKSSCNKMVLTVPYVKQSRVGLHHVRRNSEKSIFAEDEHIFELNPQDWILLLLHSGWRVIHSEIYYQYPVGWFIMSPLLSHYWQKADFEGFWGAVLEKDNRFIDRYQDWEG